jgi:glycosyltransferase involved in cell wall biosynthesis
VNYCAVAYTIYETDYRVRRYAEALVEAGNRVDAIALRVKGKSINEQMNGVDLLRIQRRHFDEKGPLSYLFKILVFFFRGAFILTCRHVRKPYEVIHIHSVPDFLVFMGFIPKLLGARIILDIHDILPEFYCQKFNNAFDTFLAKVLLSIEKISVHFADHVIVANDLWREKVIARDKVLPERCTTFLNYPNLKFFTGLSSERKGDEFKIIYPGHLSHLHGVDIALKALPIIKKEIPKIKFLIYSGSWMLDYRNYLEILRKDLALEESVEFCDPLTIEELAREYKKVDVGVVTKREGIFSSEAFSTKIFDYMAAGVPIVASKTKIDEYYFDDSMIMFFKPDDHIDLAKCIIELYKNPDKGKSLANNSKNFAAENNWQNKKEEYINLVDSMVNRIPLSKSSD